MKTSAGRCGGGASSIERPEGRRRNGATEGELAQVQPLLRHAVALRIRRHGACSCVYRNTYPSVYVIFAETCASACICVYVCINISIYLDISTYIQYVH